MTYKRYVDDCYTRFGTIQQAHIFVNVFIKQNKAVMEGLIGSTQKQSFAKLLNMYAQKMSFFVKKVSDSLIFLPQKKLNKMKKNRVNTKLSFS